LRIYEIHAGAPSRSGSSDLSEARRTLDRALNRLRRVEHEAFAGKMPAVKALSFAVNNLILVNAELSFAAYG
jgi:hypothetical protein